VQTEGQVRTWKHTEQAVTHTLKSTEAGTSQDTEINRACKGHSLAGKSRRTSQDKESPGKQGALTLWRVQRERQVRTQKQTEKARGTHILESAEGETSQDTETNRASKGHSPTGECRGRDKSGHRNKLSKQGALTFWRVQRERQVRTQKQTEQARGTHILESAEGETSQDTETNRASKGHSPTGECRGRDKSGHRNKPSKQRGTHSLESAEGETSQDTETN